MAISIFLKTAFSQTLFHSQSLVKILWRSDKDKITFKAIEKHRYGPRETVVSEHVIRAEFYKKITIYTHFFNCPWFLLTNVTSATPHIFTSIQFAFVQKCPALTSIALPSPI